MDNKLCDEHTKKIDQLIVKEAVKDSVLSSMQKQLNDISNKLDALDEKLNSRYASKWVERVVSATLIIFALAALYLIFKTAGLPY